MNGWIWYGLRRGIMTTRYPRCRESMPSGYRGAVACFEADSDVQAAAASSCPTGAITISVPRAHVDRGRCVQCGRCADIAPTAFAMTNAFEVSSVPDSSSEGIRKRLRDAASAFGRSVHVRHVDAGSDGSEEQELQALFNPFYDANRLGIFLTATPRHADILIVTGVGTEAMAARLRAAHEAMPEPRIVLALGSSACSGSIFRGGDRNLNGISRILPVDVYVPGSPPPPLAILHGLLFALGRISEREASE